MDQEKTLLNAVLVFPINKNERQILLATKSRKIGAGCWNGYGGGIKNNESPKQAAKRELREESGLIVSDSGLSKAAVINFRNTKRDGSSFICKVHIYFAHQWRGEIKETAEMKNPTWFSISKLPLNKMMPADKKWLPIVLEGQKIIATANYGPFQKKLIGPIFIQRVQKI